MATLSYDDEVQLRRLLNDFGVSPGEVGVVYQQDYFTGTGSQTAFTLSQTPVDYPVFVYLVGVLQTSPELVGISGATVTFVTAPTSGAAITCIYNFA
jgi:hypothetical protein